MDHIVLHTTFLLGVLIKLEPGALHNQTSLCGLLCANTQANRVVIFHIIHFHHHIELFWLLLRGLPVC